MRSARGYVVASPHPFRRIPRAAWIAFAKTGNPNTPQLPQWPAYAAASRETMVFNHVSRVVKDPDREQRLIMEQVLKLS